MVHPVLTGVRICLAFNFLASLINGNKTLPRTLTLRKVINAFNFLASLINGNIFFNMMIFLDKVIPALLTS